MTHFKVIVPRLNVRSAPVSDFTDKTNIISTVTAGLELELEEVFDIPNPRLGRWYRDRKNQYFSERGLSLAEREPGRLPVNLPWYISDFGINEIWEKTKGELVNVFVLDSGYKDLNDIKPDKFSALSVLDSDQFGIDQIGHGTLMASIIAGKNRFVYGIAPEAKIISIKITDELKSDCSNTLYKALLLIKECVSENTLSVVNCSLTLPLDNSDEYKKKIQNLIDGICNTSKTFFVAAVGNNYDRNNEYYPANFNNVISCAGITKGDSFFRLPSSNFWQKNSIAAPGSFDIGNLKSIFPGIFNEGSSHACAFMSGLLALKLSHSKKNNQNINNQEITQFIRDITINLTTNDDTPLVFAIPEKSKLLSNI